MEKTRQHSALGSEQLAFAAIYVGGLLILFASILLQAFAKIDALFPGIIVWGSSRIVLSAWRLLRREYFKGPPSRGRLIFSMIAWAVIVCIVLWVHLK